MESRGLTVVPLPPTPCQSWAQREQAKETSISQKSNKMNWKKLTPRDHGSRGGVGKSWTHLLPQTHQTDSYIWNNSLWKIPLRKLNSSFIIKDRRTADTVSPENPRPAWQPTTERISQIRSKRFVPHIGHPNTWDLHWRDQPAKKVWLVIRKQLIMEH